MTVRLADLARAAMTPPCTLSPTVTLDRSQGSRTSPLESWAVMIPSVATRGYWDRNCAMTSRPLRGPVAS